MDEFGKGGESLREIERILDRYGEIGRAWQDSLDLEGVIRHWMNFGKFEMLDNAWEKLKKFKRDIDRLADFWKEWLDIGLILDWIEGMLDRYGEMVRIWKDSLDNKEFGKID